MIGVRHVHGSIGLFVQQAGGIVVGTHAAFFQHHLQLRHHVGLGEGEVDHAVGLQLHHQFEAVGGDALVIGGKILGGEGVVLAAIAHNGLGELAGGHRGGALEHQVFEEMGNAVLALRLVGRADPVPHHVGDHGGAMVGDDDQLQAVGKRPVGNRDAGGHGRRETDGK